MRPTRTLARLAGYLIVLFVIAVGMLTIGAAINGLIRP